MTPLQATEAVFDAIRTGWTATKYELDGEIPQTARTPYEAWIRAAVRDMPPVSVTHGPTGGRAKRCRANLIAQIFAPTTDESLLPVDGSGPALELAQTFATLFEGKDLGTAGDTLTLYEADVRRIGADAAWYQVNVSIRFDFTYVF